MFWTLWMWWIFCTLRKNINKILTRGDLGEHCYKNRRKLNLRSEIDLHQICYSSNFYPLLWLHDSGLSQWWWWWLYTCMYVCVRIYVCICMYVYSVYVFIIFTYLFPSFFHLYYVTIIFLKFYLHKHNCKEMHTILIYECSFF